jgi:superfamily II DNA/RNA helicase
VYDLKHESKFDRLWAALEEYPDTKVLIFTEFRGTLDFLIDRLEGQGLTGKIARIHGGMDFREREQQADFFRKADGARILVATDAAGEGINLQFCWLLINYDIPWNPARLEQRMGRVHRYKQTHEVVLINLVSQDTREGRVLKVLLDKLENIRRELGNDKVFDIIGRQFSGRPLTDLIFEAVVEGKEAQATREIERTLDAQQVTAQMATQERKVEVSEVRALLGSLKQQEQTANERRMMPAYVRRFFEQAGPHVGAGIRGDIEGIFWLDPCPPSVQAALANYPETLQRRLTFDRDRAKPDLTRDPLAIYLRPGETVFEAVMNLFLARFESEAMRGALFFDPATREPYLFYLARTGVFREPAPDESREPEIVEEQMIGVRRFADRRFEAIPAHLLLTLFPPEPGDPPHPGIPQSN